MSQNYQVLARKYRPKNFHELVGQEHVSKALINAIDNDRLHHAYLFTGTRGVGKTTIGRILAKCLNCDNGITSAPCEQCNSCQMIEQGRFIDLIEIDAASRTKVEDTRELLDNVPYAPTQGRLKVYLIDEVHMLSTHSFNALLKTLEEPPAHVKFLLATTDPQKLPITIISRCLQFVLRPLPQEQLSGHLANILQKENIVSEEAALWQLAHAARGSVRDSLSLTDQAIAFGQGQLTEAAVVDMLGLINDADLIHLLTAIYRDNKAQVAQHLENMRMQMVDANSIFDELSELIHKIALAQMLPTINLNVNATQAQKITEVAALMSADVLQLYYEIVITARERIKLATTPMQALEMCLLRMLAFRPLASNQVMAVEASAQPVAVLAEPVHQEPVHQEPVHQEPVIEICNEDPRNVLKVEKQELIGDWDADKWDYWLQTARENQALDKDELAFARQGMMTGQCNGDAAFITDLNSQSLQFTFESLIVKIKEEFPDINCQLYVQSEGEHNASDVTQQSYMQEIPQNRKIKRENIAKAKAETMLENSPTVKEVKSISNVLLKNVTLNSL